MGILLQLKAGDKYWGFIKRETSHAAYGNVIASESNQAVSQRVKQGFFIWLSSSTYVFMQL